VARKARHESRGRDAWQPLGIGQTPRLGHHAGAARRAPDPRQVFLTRGMGAWIFCRVRYTAQAVQAEVPMTAHGGKAGELWPFLLSPAYGRSACGSNRARRTASDVAPGKAYEKTKAIPGLARDSGLLARICDLSAIGSVWLPTYLTCVGHCPMGFPRASSAWFYCHLPTLTFPW
jgi:hypothetical protein